MTAVRPIFGGIFLAILLVGATYAVVSPTLQPIRFPRLNLPWSGGKDNIVRFYSLVRDANVSAAVRFVILNVTMKFGGINVLFSDKPNIVCGVSLQRSVNASELQANYSTSNGGQTLDINLYAETGGLNLTLGKDYQYGGDFGLRIGSVVMDVGQYANISRMAFSIKYMGALVLDVGTGAAFDQLNANMNMGGMQLIVDAENLKKNGAINADVSIGGFAASIDVNTGNIGVSLNSTVDIGGLAVTHSDFHGSVSARDCSVKTTGYESAPKKVDIKVAVGLGGGTLQKPAVFQSFGVNP
jgi:hypothetical protein